MCIVIKTYIIIAKLKKKGFQNSTFVNRRTDEFAKYPFFFPAQLQQNT
jgi:hypothetical protein